MYLTKTATIERPHCFQRYNLVAALLKYIFVNMSKNQCKSCRIEIDSSAKFCPECGSRQENLTHDQPDVKPDKSPKDKAFRFRETLVTIGVVALITLGYFVIVEPELVPKPDQPQLMAGHSDGGMEITLPNLPEDFEGLVAVGDNYMDEGNFPLAAECYKRALEIDSASVNLRSDFGSCLYGMGLGGRALEEFRKVLAIDASHGIALFNLGVVFSGQGLTDSAKFYMGAYLKLEPEGNAADRARDLINEMGL